MTHALKALEEYLKRSGQGSVFLGVSVTNVPYFCTIKNRDGTSGATGKGHSLSDAIMDAVGRPRPVVETQPSLPGVTRPAAPMTTRLPGM